jgi:hypothetical protein
VFARRRPLKAVTMAKASLNDSQALYAVNDLFVGPQSHTSALYTIRLGDREERQSSSGVLVSTGLGSTAWYRSVVTGAAAIAGRPFEFRPTPWDARYLHFAVREPFPSRSSGASLVFGRIEAGAALVLESRMAERGVIFSDGIEADYLEFNSGAVARIEVAERQGSLVV